VEGVNGSKKALTRRNEGSEEHEGVNGRKKALTRRNEGSEEHEGVNGRKKALTRRNEEKSVENLKGFHDSSPTNALPIYKNYLL
jgi:hypothetical protein